MKEKIVFVGIPIVAKRGSEGPSWFLIKEEDGGWEFPKSIARKGESSVRAAIRCMAEQGGIRLKVLEEAGRAGGAVRLDKKVVTQKHLYYLGESKDEGQELGFQQWGWFPHTKALRMLEGKREKEMLKEAKKIFKEVLKARALRRKQRAQELLLQQQ